MTPEGRTKALIRREIEKAFPTSYRFMPVQNGMGAPGLDFFYCIHGLFVAIEAKAPRKTPTPRQDDTMQAIADAEGLVFVVDGIDALKDMLSQIAELLDANNRF